MNAMSKETNLNTILISVLLAVMGWVGYEVSDLGKKVSAMTQANSTSDRELLELRARVLALEIWRAGVDARAGRP
jgi:hypothetical protein